MVISTVKPYTIHTIQEKKLKKLEFADEFKSATDTEALKRDIQEALTGNGRVYGIYRKKRHMPLQLVGVYIFEKKENYFVKSEENGVKLGDHELDFDKFWYGSDTSALCFKKSICLDEVEEHIIKKIEKDLSVDLTNQIELGNVAGVEWNNKLMYRKFLEKKNTGTFVGVISGFALGFILGWIIFNKIYMGFSFGLMYSVIFSSFGVVIAKKSDIDTLDFIRKEDHDAAE